MSVSATILGLLWLIETVLLIAIGILWCMDRSRTVNALPGILMMLLALEKILLLIPVVGSLSLLESNLLQIKQPLVLPAILFKLTIISYQICLIHLQIQQAKLTKKATKDVRR